MKVIPTKIEGCFVLQPRVFKDERGSLVKTFHDETFRKEGLQTDFREEYFSTSNKGVLRGLHFQLPPNDHVKCVTCISGEIYDVVVDLRMNSKTYGENFSIILNDLERKMLYIPKGLAHGFYVMSKEAIFLNRTDVVFKPESDTGIKWDSCGINWPNSNPILSEKDKNLIEFKNFISPF